MEHENASAAVAERVSMGGPLPTGSEYNNKNDANIAESRFAPSFYPSDRRRLAAPGDEPGFDHLFRRASANGSSAHRFPPFPRSCWRLRSAVFGHSPSRQASREVDPL